MGVKAGLRIAYSYQILRKAWTKSVDIYLILILVSLFDGIVGQEIRCRTNVAVSDVGLRLLRRVAMNTSDVTFEMVRSRKIFAAVL